MIHLSSLAKNLNQIHTKWFEQTHIQMTLTAYGSTSNQKKKSCDVQKNLGGKILKESNCVDRGSSPPIINLFKMLKDQF